MFLYKPNKVFSEGNFVFSLKSSVDFGNSFGTLKGHHGKMVTTTPTFQSYCWQENNKLIKGIENLMITLALFEDEDGDSICIDTK